MLAPSPGKAETSSTTIWSSRCSDDLVFLTGGATSRLARAIPALLEAETRLRRISRVEELPRAAGLLVVRLPPLLTPVVLITASSAPTPTAPPLALPAVTSRRRRGRASARGRLAGRGVRVAKDLGPCLLVPPLLLLEFPLLPPSDLFGGLLRLLIGFVVLVVRQGQLLEATYWVSLGNDRRGGLAAEDLDCWLEGR
jgi:hypothetical protein